MLTKMRKEARAQINKAFAEKQRSLGIQTFRFSLPDAAQAEFAIMAEVARADHYKSIVETAPDGDARLDLLAQSNKPTPALERDVRAVVDAGYVTLSEDYKARLSAYLACEQRVSEALKAGDAAAATRAHAEAFVEACYMRILKQRIMDVLAQEKS